MSKSIVYTSCNDEATCNIDYFYNHKKTTIILKTTMDNVEIFHKINDSLSTIDNIPVKNNLDIPTIFIWGPVIGFALGYLTAKMASRN